LISNIKVKIKRFIFKYKLNKYFGTGKLILTNDNHRGFGKTTMLVDLAVKHNMVIICPNETQARYINNAFKHKIANTHNTIAFSCSNVDRLKGRRFPNGVLVDEGVDSKTINNIHFNISQVKGGFFYSNRIVK
jgi:hypothetical protein